MSIGFESQGARALFCGDVMHHPIQVYRPTWNSVFCADQEKSRSARRWVLDYAAQHEAQLFTAHFSDTSSGFVKRAGSGFSWCFV